MNPEYVTVHPERPRALSSSHQFTKIYITMHTIALAYPPTPPRRGPHRCHNETIRLMATFSRPDRRVFGPLPSPPKGSVYETGIYQVAPINSNKIIRTTIHFSLNDTQDEMWTNQTPKT
jgi:hypothetical protein